MAPEIGKTLNANQLRNSSEFSSSMVQPQYEQQTTFQPITGSVPPPIPTRQTNYSGQYNDYRSFGSNHYGNYDYRGYGGGYSGYNLFGNHMPFSNMPAYHNNPHGLYNTENRFQQYAEESARSTFHIIETTLHTFQSITTVLDSTYFALTNSFRALFNLAESIGKLRSTLGHFLSTIALIRCLKWIYRRILVVLGIRKQNSFDQDIWQQSFLQEVGKEEQQTLTWPNILLLVAFTAIPYFIHKISSNVKRIQVQASNPSNWFNCQDPVKIASVQYNFTATSRDELNLKVGQKIWVAPQSLQPNIPGWWLATNSKSTGLIPSNYVTLTGYLRKLERKNNINTSAYMQIPAHTQHINSNKMPTTYADASNSPFDDSIISCENLDGNGIISCENLDDKDTISCKDNTEGKISIENKNNNRNKENKGNDSL